MASGVVDALIAEPRARVHQGVVTVDGVAVEVQGDVFSSDHDPVVGAVDQVAVQRCIGGDGVRSSATWLASAWPPPRTVKPATTSARTIALERSGLRRRVGRNLQAEPGREKVAVWT